MEALERGKERGGGEKWANGSGTGICSGLTLDSGFDMGGIVFSLFFRYFSDIFDLI